MDIHFGYTKTEALSLKLETFRRHMVCLGASGSGKTVACKVICEEFIRQGVPVIAIDPQGDIASLMEIEDPKVSVSKGVSTKQIQDYEKNAEVVVWTPASTIGVPLSLNPIGNAQNTLQKKQSYEQVLRTVSLAADSITALLDYELSSEEGRLVSGILNLALTFINENELPIYDFTSLADFLEKPDEDLQERIKPIASNSNLQKLSKKLRLLTVGVKSLLFELGKPLNIEALLGLGENASQKTRLSVIYLNTLGSQEEKEFFIARLASSLYQWMIANPSEKLQALFYIDEVAPFLPPVRKPACKDILKLLFKQARKYGVGCLIASQNPADIDYMALSQCSTWCLGRLISPQDIKKVEKVLRSLASEDCDGIIEKLPSLKPGKFMLFAPDEFKNVVELQIRWLITKHKTLDEEKIQALVPDSLRQAYLLSSKQTPPQTKSLSNTTDSSHCSAETKKETKKETENFTPEERILKFLEEEPGCFTSTEIADRLEVATSTARRYLSRLEKQVKKVKQGKNFLYWHKRYSFLPEHGLTYCVDIAKLQVLEREAMRLAQKQLKRQLVFFETEKITHTDLYYLPLWQVNFTEELEKSFLFFKTTSHKQENIYFHAITGKVCGYERGNGFYFVDTPRESPSLLIDLDDVCTFDCIPPGEIDLEPGIWNDILSELEIEKRIARKFKIDIHKIRMSFLPVWRFELTRTDNPPNEKDKKRTLFLDGVTGMPI